MPHSPYPNENCASSFSLLFFSQVVTQKLLCLWTYPQLITTRMKLSHLWREHINLTLHWQLESATFLKYLSFVLPSIHLRCIWARCYFILLVFLGDKVNFLLFALLNDMSLTTLVTWFFPSKLFLNFYFSFFIYRYASRVKLITNDAQKNADNKEINRLKGVSLDWCHTLARLHSVLARFLSIYSYLLLLFQIIAKLKKGETVDDAEVED